MSRARKHRQGLAVGSSREPCNANSVPLLRLSNQGDVNRAWPTTDSASRGRVNPSRAYATASSGGTRRDVLATPRPRGIETGSMSYVSKAWLWTASTRGPALAPKAARPRYCRRGSGRGPPDSIPAGSPGSFWNSPADGAPRRRRARRRARFSVPAKVAELTAHSRRSRCITAWSRVVRKALLHGDRIVSERAERSAAHAAQDGVF